VKKKIYLYLCGGLGNQLFQYAAARNLAIKNNAKLIIDISTGFILDIRDRRKFSLNLNLKKITNVFFKKNIINFWIFIFIKKIFKLKKVFNDFYFFSLINEMLINYYQKKIKNFNINKSLYLFGYFQSEKYFYENKDLITKELMPTTPKDKIFLEIKKKIKKKNAISIGVRMYEDLPSNIHYKFGGLTPVNFYKNAIRLICNKITDPIFFLFSTKNSNLEKLFLEIPQLKNYKNFFITEENNFKGAKKNLWLMSHCRNHIISNSSLYWWGAYFSSLRYNSQTIICSANFINRDTCPISWKVI
jgi:hypothetical protein